MKSMKLYILRHGETNWNTRHLFQGQTNTKLNDAGISQAKACRERVREMGLTFDYVVSSPLDRALTTASIVSGLPKESIPTDKRLMEMNFGALDATPFTAESPLANTLLNHPSKYVAGPGAETYDQVIARADSFFAGMAKTRPGESVLVGAHGCIMRCMLVDLGYLDLDEIWHQGIGNCTIIEAELDGEKGKFHVVRIDETRDFVHTTAKTKE